MSPIVSWACPDTPAKARECVVYIYRALVNVLGDLAKGLWRSAESSASRTGWSSDLSLGTASKWHLSAFLEA